MGLTTASRGDGVADEDNFDPNDDDEMMVQIRKSRKNKLIRIGTIIIRGVEEVDSTGPRNFHSCFFCNIRMVGGMDYNISMELC